MYALGEDGGGEDTFWGFEARGQQDMDVLWEEKGANRNHIAVQIFVASKASKWHGGTLLYAISIIYLLLVTSSIDLRPHMRGVNRNANRMRTCLARGCEMRAGSEPQTPICTSICTPQPEPFVFLCVQYIDELKKACKYKPPVKVPSQLHIFV